MEYCLGSASDLLEGKTLNGSIINISSKIWVLLAYFQTLAMIKAKLYCLGVLFLNSRIMPLATPGYGFDSQGMHELTKCVF